MHHTTIHAASTTVLRFFRGTPFPFAEKADSALTPVERARPSPRKKNPAKRQQSPSSAGRSSTTAGAGKTVLRFGAAAPKKANLPRKEVAAHDATQPYPRNFCQNYGVLPFRPFTFTDPPPPIFFLGFWF